MKKENAVLKALKARYFELAKKENSLKTPDPELTKELDELQNEIRKLINNVLEQPNSKG